MCCDHNVCETISLCDVKLHDIHQWNTFLTFLKPNFWNILFHILQDKTDPVGCIFHSGIILLVQSTWNALNYPEVHHLFFFFSKIHIYLFRSYVPIVFFNTCPEIHKEVHFCDCFVFPFFHPVKRIKQSNCGLYINNLLA